VAGPLTIIGIGINMNHIITNKVYNGHGLYRVDDPYNPLNLPPYTMRLKYTDGYTPRYYDGGSATQISQSPNIWDFNYNSNNWNNVFYFVNNLTDVLGGNTKNVSSMHSMFYRCSSLTSLILFDTSEVTDAYSMFEFCTNLPYVPLLNTTKLKDMNSMFKDCPYVSGGILNLYNQLIAQQNPPTYHSFAFKNCGISSQAGSAELAQIRSDWK
jgi:hypothetical protein